MLIVVLEFTMKVLGLYTAIFSIAGLVHGALIDLPLPDVSLNPPNVKLPIPGGGLLELSAPNVGSEVVDPCIRNRPECSLAKLVSESSWTIGEILGIQYISYGEFWKLLGCTCEEISETEGKLTCDSDTIILNSCPCYGCIPLGRK